MNRQQQQEHAIRIVAEYLDDNLSFTYVFEDEELEDHEDSWQAIHDLCGMILDQLHHQVNTSKPADWQKAMDQRIDQLHGPGADAALDKAIADGYFGPRRYRKKPVVVEAIRWDGTAEGATSIIDWILSNGGSGNYECDSLKCSGTDEAHHLEIRTPEGGMAANPGDWIIRGVQGEFYPVKDPIFRKTYEAVDR